MADKMPWFPFYLDRWETDNRVRAMGPVARSYYLILLMHQWREGFIKDSRKTLLRLLTLPSDPVVSVPRFPPDSGSGSDMDLLDYEAILDQVLECFDSDGNGGLVNKRMQGIRNEQLSVRERKSEGGKKARLKSLERVLKDTSINTNTNTNTKDKGGGTVYKQGKTPSPSQKDFDERDLRLMAQAERKIGERLQARVGGGGGITEGQFFEAVCEEVGITVERGLALRKIQRSWPK